MMFKYEGHDAGGTQRTGVVEAKSIEEAAGIIRMNKVYARKIVPDDTIRPAAVDSKVEALRQVRAQAHINDNVGVGSKAYVYTPQGDQAIPEAEMGQFKAPQDCAPVGCGLPETWPQPGEMGCEMGSGDTWEEQLEHDLKMVDEVVTVLGNASSLKPDIIGKLRLEMIRQATLTAFERTCRS